jgi:hypothetical protein
MKINLRTVPTVAVAGLALASLGWTMPGVAETCGLDFWSVPELQARLEENQRQQAEIDVEDQRVLQRIDIKEGLITELIDGRTTILEVAAQFKLLNDGRQDYLRLFHKQYPGASDDECFCRNVVAFADARLCRLGRAGHVTSERLHRELERLTSPGRPLVLRNVPTTELEPLAAGQ